MFILGSLTLAAIIAFIIWKRYLLSSSLGALASDFVKGITLSLGAFALAALLAELRMPDAIFVASEELLKFVGVRWARSHKRAVSVLLAFSLSELLGIKIIYNWGMADDAIRALIDQHFFYYAVASIVPALMHLAVGLIYRLRYPAVPLLVSGIMMHWAYNNIVYTLNSPSAISLLILVILGLGFVLLIGLTLRSVTTSDLR